MLILWVGVPTPQYDLILTDYICNCPVSKFGPLLGSQELGLQCVASSFHQRLRILTTFGPYPTPELPPTLPTSRPSSVSGNACSPPLSLSVTSAAV